MIVPAILYLGYKNWLWGGGAWTAGRGFLGPPVWWGLDLTSGGVLLRPSWLLGPLVCGRWAVRQEPGRVAWAEGPNPPRPQCPSLWPDHSPTARARPRAGPHGGPWAVLLWVVGPADVGPFPEDPSRLSTCQPHTAGPCSLTRRG